MTLPEPTSAKPTMMRGLPKDVADPAKPIRARFCPSRLDATERNRLLHRVGAHVTFCFRRRSPMRTCRGTEPRLHYCEIGDRLI